MPLTECVPRLELPAMGCTPEAGSYQLMSLLATGVQGALPQLGAWIR